jgi:hypothetical protein
MFASFYDSLARKGDIDTLMFAAKYDERVYETVVRHDLLPAVIGALPSAEAAKFLSNGIYYSEVSGAAMVNFVPICSHLARYETAAQGAALAELLGNIAAPEAHRTDLFNFSETFRHLILSRNLFAQRGVMRCLSHMFSDDFLGDAVAVLQYKSDILNHINRLYVDTPDFVAWRFSVRVMSLAGGYNEDRVEVDKTERLCRFLTQVLPEFGMFWLVGFSISVFRHRPRRMHGEIPKWLSRARARMSGTVCGLLGVWTNSALDYRMMRERQYYELHYAAEMRRRKGAAARGKDFADNKYFDNLEGVTRRLFTVQAQHYGGAGAVLGASLLPLKKIMWPEFMGDVVWRHAFIPRLFPVTVNLPAASKCFLPFVVSPFLTASALVAGFNGLQAYDHYVHQRYRWWKKFRGSESYEIEMLDDE